MAKNTNLGGVFTTDIDSERTNNVFLSTENCCGLIFDTSLFGGLEKALGESTVAATVFAEGNVVELNSPTDLVEAGIDETLMGGLVKYHLDSFFSLAGGNQRLFVSFMDSDQDTEFEAVEKMQLAADGIIYQIGIWTGKPFASKEESGDIVINPGNILSKLHAQAELLGGKVGVTNFEGNAPLNIIVSAPAINEAEVDYTKLPDISELEYPKISVLIGQAATDQVHEIMYAINHITEGTQTYVQVGAIGAMLGCFAIAPANESIAHVQNFNLAAVMRTAELGFGKLVDASNKYDTQTSFTNIKTLGYKKRNENLHKKGYIFLTNYDGLENSIFFSSDQTLTMGDYSRIARCRVMHKSRRIIRRAYLPYVNDDVEIDVSTGKLSSTEIAKFQNIGIQALDINMVEPGTSKPQISGRTLTVDPDSRVLENDEINIYYGLVPLGLASAIFVTEGFQTTA